MTVTNTDAVLCCAMLCRVFAAAGVTHWQSPNYFSWFPGNTSMPGVLAEMLIAALNMVGFSWQSSPVSTELEMVSVRAGQQQCEGEGTVRTVAGLVYGRVQWACCTVQAAADSQHDVVDLCVTLVSLTDHDGLAGQAVWAAGKVPVQVP
jgi:hypothetical protein